MKRLIPAFIFVLFLCGCGKTPTTLPPADLASDLLEKCSFSEELQSIAPEVVTTLYGLHATDISECCVFLSAGATAEELAAISAVDEDAADRVETALQQRVAAQTEAYKSYKPEEIPKLESAVIHRSGTTVILVVAAEDPAEIISALF